MVSAQSARVFVHVHVSLVAHTVIQEIFVVKKFLYSSKITKIKHMKYFQRTYYQELIEPVKRAREHATPHIQCIDTEIQTWLPNA